MQNCMEFSMHKVSRKYFLKNTLINLRLILKYSNFKKTYLHLHHNQASFYLLSDKKQTSMKKRSL